MRMHRLFSSSFLRWLIIGSQLSRCFLGKAVVAIAPTFGGLATWVCTIFFRRKQYVQTCGYCKLICYDIPDITHITTVYSRTCLLYRKYMKIPTFLPHVGIIWHHLPEAMLIAVNWKVFMSMSITEHMFNAMRPRCSHAAKRLPGTTFSRKRQNSCSCRRTMGDPP